MRIASPSIPLVALLATLVCAITPAGPAVASASGHAAPPAPFAPQPSARAGDWPMAAANAAEKHPRTWPRRP